MVEPVSPEAMIRAMVSAWPSPWTGCDEVWAYVSASGVATWCPVDPCQAAPTTALYLAQHALADSQAYGVMRRDCSVIIAVAIVRGRHLGAIYDQVDGGLVLRRVIDPAEDGIGANESRLRDDFLAGCPPCDDPITTSAVAVDPDVVAAVERVAAGSGGSAERERQRRAAAALTDHRDRGGRRTAAIDRWWYAVARESGLWRPATW